MKKVILNQKCYMTLEEMEEYKSKFEKIKTNNLTFIIFPPVLYLTLFNNSKYNVGTQNFFSYNSGSFTGEISLEQLRKIGVRYTLIGHYERRKIIGETYSTSKEKLFKSLSSKFYTILCVGEQKKTKRPFSYIKKELNYYLKNIESSNIEFLSIAYEPNWAVGSGDVQCIEKIAKTISEIKQYICNKYQFDIEVYYGGSISEDNIKDILEITDGIVLGKASIDIDNLKSIVNHIL